MNTAKTTIGMILSAAMLLGSTAEAGTPGEVMYRAQLDRCLAALRADLQDPATTKILYTITSIDKQGAWYQFDIQSAVYHETTAAPVRETDSRCRARRWSDEMEIDGR